MTKTYRPRALLRLTIPLPKNGDFQPYTYDVEVSRARLELNDHNHADVLTVDVDWLSAGVDPRWISGGTCEFYLGSADDSGEWEPRDDNLRFVGRMVKPERSVNGDSLRVSLLFHDYTSFFLLAKPVASDAIPRYSETLQDAWARLCHAIPGCDDLADNIEFRGLDAPGPVIGSAVADRFRQLGTVPVKPGVDAWAIWQQVVGMCGLIAFFEQDLCVVTTATDYYSAQSTPRFIWGTNILSFTESRNNDRGLRGVGITSYDPLTGKTLEAVYDPLAGQRKPKKPAAHVRHRGHKATQPKLVTTSEVDYFTYPGVTDPDRLQEIAKRVYEERSRQELDGNLTTADMTIETTAQEEIDLLSLRQGDTIEVRFLDTDDAEFVKQIESRDERTAYLVSRGYPPETAQIIAANVDRITDKSSLFFVKSASIDYETTEDGGKFRVSVDFINKIDISGGTAGV